jgi:hypothetical protein
MDNLSKPVLMLFTLVLFIGTAASTCEEGCDYTAEDNIVQGTTINLHGPELSPDGRTLDYEWRIYLCDGTDITTGVFGTQTGKDLTFIAPPAGDYRVALTVRDQEFPQSCYDVKSICLTTTEGECPTLCCGNVCEVDTTSPRTGCPWHMEYTGLHPTGYVFKWLIDGLVHQSSDATSVDIDWTLDPLPAGVGGVDIPLPVGAHTLSFQIWAPDPADPTTLVMLQECKTSCTCDPTTLTPCTVNKVEKPIADIMEL